MERNDIYFCSWHSRFYNIRDFDILFEIQLDIIEWLCAATSRQ
jgi:hypothetical protein